MTQTPGEKIAALVRDVENNRDDIRDVRDDIKALTAKVEAHSALMRWIMGIAAGAGAVGTLLVKRVGEALGL